MAVSQLIMCHSETLCCKVLLSVTYWKHHRRQTSHYSLVYPILGGRLV